MCNFDLVGFQFESKHPSDSESVIVLACNNVGGDMIIKSSNHWLIARKSSYTTL